MITLYIAGPMSGLAENNYPAFMHMEARLRDAGYGVLNPAKSNLEETAPFDYVDETTTWQAYMRNGINQLIRADGVCLLDGWEGSRGARLEKTIAEQLQMSVSPWYFWLSAPTMPSSPLEHHDETSLVHIEP